MAPRSDEYGMSSGEMVGLILAMLVALLGVILFGG